jgi:hypothetical protein
VKFVNAKKIIEENIKKVDEFILKINNEANKLKGIFEDLIHIKVKNVSLSKLQRCILAKIQNNELDDLRGKHMSKAYG